MPRSDTGRQRCAVYIGIASADSGSYYALFNIASRFGLDPNSIETISLRSPAGELAALSRGEVDAALLPFATALQSGRGREPLLPLSNFAQWQQGVVFTTAKNITTRRNLIDRFMRAYQRGTADYQLNFLSYDDAGDFIPGPSYDRYLDLIARSANFFQCSGHNENLLRSAREPRRSRYRETGAVLARPGPARQAHCGCRSSRCFLHRGGGGHVSVVAQIRRTASIFWVDP